MHCLLSTCHLLLILISFEEPPHLTDKPQTYGGMDTPYRRDCEFRREFRRKTSFTAGITPVFAVFRRDSRRPKNASRRYSKLERDKMNSGGTGFLQPGFAIPLTHTSVRDSRPEASDR